MNDSNLHGLETELTAHGVRAALSYLNHCTGHRFSAVYIFNAGLNHNLFFYDRENPTEEQPGDFDDLPIEVTYCVYVNDFNQPFVVEDSFTDARVANHPAIRKVRSYCGVPLDHPGTGRPVGTICHFSHEPATIDGEHVELMQAMAGLIVAAGLNQ